MAGRSSKLEKPVRDRLTAGRLALDQEVGVRIPVPQPSTATPVVVSAGYFCNSLSKHFVISFAAVRAAFATVIGSLDTSGSRGRAAPLSSTRRFDSEDPIRWPVRPLSGDTGLCGGERREFPDHSRPPSSDEAGSARSLLADAFRAEARRSAEASQRHPFLREPSLAPQLYKASERGRHGARARGTATRARNEDHRRAQARAEASRGAAAGECATEARDLPRFRATLLR